MFRYCFIRFLQIIVKVSNYIQKLIPSKFIDLRWDEKILIIKWDRIWDAVWTIWFIKILKDNYPGLNISVLCNQYNRFVFEQNQKYIDSLYSLDEFPPSYFVKNFYKFFFFVFDSFALLFRNYKFFRWLKSQKYDYVLNFTWRKYSIVSKYIWKNVWWWLGILNFFYNYPLKFHNEIDSKIHLIDKRLDIFRIKNDNIKIYENKKASKILLFVGWKYPNKLSIEQYDKIKDLLLKKWFDISVLSDDSKLKADFYLKKNLNWFSIENQSFEEFLKEYDLFIWVDWWVLHYVSQYLPTVGFYLSTNPFVAHPYWWKLVKIDKNQELYKTYDNRHVVVYSGASCCGCFQIWCEKRICLKSLDIRIEIIINLIVWII